MTSKVYYNLREQLDQYSVGFPATESGVEMRILERLFTEEDAAMYLKLSMMLETAGSIKEGANVPGSSLPSRLGNAHWDSAV